MPARPRNPLSTGFVIALLCAAGITAGCGGDGGDGGGDVDGLTVAVTPSTVEPGGQVGARVVNHTAEQFTYGAGYELEREVDGAFEAVELPRRAVIQIAYIAKPGEDGPPVQVKVPGDAEPGRWRVVIQRDVPGSGDLSGEFEVTGG